MVSSKSRFQESGVLCVRKRRRRRDGETQREAGTWKTRIFLSSSQLGLWKSGGAQCEAVLMLPFSLSLSPVSLQLCNHSLTQPEPVLLLCILINQGNYSSRFWSVSLWCFCTVTGCAVFVIVHKWQTMHTSTFYCYTFCSCTVVLCADCHNTMKFHSPAENG